MSISVFFAVFFAVFFILQTNIGSDAVQINISPPKCIATVQNKVHISCEAGTDDDGSNDVTLIELSRNGKDPMVYLRDCSNLTYGDDGTGRLQAEGQISKTPGQTYLNMTLRNPMSQDTGIYTCTVLYLNTHGKAMQTLSSSNLVVEKLDVESLETVLTSLTNKLAALEENHEKQMTDLNGKDCATMSNMAAFRKNVSQQLQELNVKDSAIINNMTTYSQATSKQLHELKDKVGYTVAFSAYSGNDITTTSRQTLIFPNIIMQIGHGYDTKTGIFTAPRKGIYVFHLVVTDRDHCHLHVSLKVNDQIVAHLYTKNKDTHDQSSITTVAELKPGDKVFSYPDKGGCRLIYNKFSVFTGYLIQAL